MGWKITKRDKPKEKQNISWVTDAGEVVDGIYIQGIFYALDEVGNPISINYIPEYWITNEDWKR